ncbi:MAG TPA: hypothetical protein VGM90_18840 [Kofleriaceae bacterium]|jgi:hypothetical protein
MRPAYALVAVAALAATAHADDAIVHGSIVKIEQQEIYVTLGSAQGVDTGAALRIKRTIRLKHPVTRAVVEDWIPIGAATVTQAGASLSRAVVGEMVGDVKVGDVVEIYVNRPDEPAPTAPTRPVPQAPPSDPATMEVLGLFAQQTGQSLDARIAGWERYLSQRANSPYAEAIRTDVQVMRDLREQLRTTAAPSGTDVVTTAHHEVRSIAPIGQDVPLVFVLDEPSAVASAYLHYRTTGERTYRRVLLQREHDQYLRGTLPAAVVKAPGVEYFVEVSTPRGTSGLAAGAPERPLSITVAPPSVLDTFAPRRDQSSVKLTGEYLDFATFDKRSGDHSDHMSTASVDFTYRLGGTVDAIGVGYGVYAGAGGSKNATWDPANPMPQTGFHYGYASIELGTKAENVALSFEGALLAGVGKDGFGVGGSGLVRIGERDQANLSFLLRTIDQVGTLSEIRFGDQPWKDVLLGISVGATNQPNGDDVGAKLGTDLEWIGFGNTSIILRASWQGRSSLHGGVGGGAGLGFYW